MSDGRGPATTEPAPATGQRRTRWSAVAAAVLIAGGAATLGVAATRDAPPEQPDLVSSPQASTPSTPDAAPVPGTTPGTTADAARDRATPSATASAVADPVTLSVPAIGVSSPLLHLGLADDGTIAVPQPGPDYDRAAWFTGSPRPGETGPAVLEGHVDSAAGGPSVFYRLGELSEGDVVTVERADGSSVDFAVTGSQRYAKDDFPTLAVYGNTEGPELRLITCGGPFDATTGHYRDNTVVYARQV